MIDVTEMTDAAFDVLLAIKAGEECVVVDHLTPEERYSVCAALGVTAKTHWLFSLPYVAPEIGKAKISHIDVEGLLLDQADAFYEGE